MKTKYFIFAASALVALASCSSDEYIGDSNGLAGAEGDGSIQFSYSMQNSTRADIVGDAAADLLGNGFYVIGTKGSEGEKNPSENLVFDNYLVYFNKNTAGKTESNTANWEYVGVTPGSSSYTNWAKLSDLSAQTIKYWDYSVDEYDFHAFSTGKKQAVKDVAIGSLANTQIGVTKSQYGEGLKNGATAYTFLIPTTEALQGAYITDITTVEKSNYGKEVKLTFKNLGSKIRLALYETVPGYSVKDVKFYTVDKADASVDDLAGEHSTTAALISADATNGFFTKGTVVVSFPKLGTTNSSDGNYKKASVSVTPVAPETPTLSQTFGTLDYKKDKEGSEAAGTIYLGRNVTEATFAGKSAVDYYQVVFPVTNSQPLTLRVDYTLVATDGSGETIKVYGAKAVVPSTYTVWQPNYAYTYIFKISDNTNGWTSTDATKPAGLFPITFDAVVAETKEISGEQRTVTTVATPSITTYQQGHDKDADEYSKATGKKIYVQVMDNSTATATLCTNLNDVDPYVMSKLYEVTTTSTPISEATVMDALQNRTTDIDGTDDATLTGRNGITLTKNANISNTIETIVNGADNKPIDLRDDDPGNPGSKLADSGKGKAAEINITALSAGTYAYVYDYGDVAKTTKTFYQPTSQKSGTIANGKKYITTASLGSTVTAADEAVADGYVYFSKTTTDGVNYTYSFVSVDGKTTLPAGLLKVAVGSLSTSNGSAEADANTFVFDIYKRNTGKYAVKVIKVVA